jgi:ubiquinone biosynthesis accessory factor UbiK
MAIFKELDELASRIAAKMPGTDTALTEDFRRNVRALLESAFRDMNLVTREEFDVQAALLERTRERLEALQQKLEDLDRSSQ